MSEISSFDHLLSGLRAHGAFALRAVMSPPWSLRVVAEAPLTVLAAVKGEIWILPDHAEPVHLFPGDVAVTRGPDHYTVADSPDTMPTIIIHPGQECRSPSGESLLESLTHGVRTWGNDPSGPCLMLVGAYQSKADVSESLSQTLPPVLSLSHDDWNSPLTAMLCEEVGKEAPGQAAVLDRMLDLLLMAVLRAWFDRAKADEVKWYRAKSDPVVNRAVELMHRAPSESWTVDVLARKTGVSRSVLSRRFHAIVGEPPMTFLTHWRMALAADLLCSPDVTISAVAEQVGYSCPFALSTAFKRVRGMSPQKHREQHAPAMG